MLYTYNIWPHTCFLLTSISYIEFDAEVSTRASWVMTGSENDTTDGFYLPDDAGDSRRGQDAIVSNHQAPYLQNKKKRHG